MSRTVLRKVSLIIIFILILLVIALLVGKVTYSYLAPTIDPDRTLESEVTASGDTLIFTKGNNLSLSATTDNFKTGGTNISDTTNPKVKLVSSSKTNNASSTYYVGVYIPTNTFSYTTTTSTPELILTIKDENGANVTSVTGLTYVTQNNVSGFDITGKSGLFNIKVDYPIATTSSTTGVTHTWTFTLTFINLSTDQSVNENAKIDIDVYVQRKKFNTSLADVCTNGDNLATCIKNLSDSSKVEFTNIYKHDTNLTNGAGDNSYRYAGSYESVNNYVCFGTDAESCPNDNLYRIIGVFGSQVKLIKADFATSTALGTSGAYTSNTYSASSYSNYKGSLTTINRYYWTSSDNSSNVWSGSALNATNLNGTYLTNLGTTWTNKIETTTWKVGGNTWANIGTSAMNTAYQNEIVTPAASTTHPAKIGLMYVSDYGYAASPTYWTYPGCDSKGSWNSDYTVWNGNDYSKAVNDNWMYMGLYEWTISRGTDNSSGAFNVYSVGGVGNDNVYNYSGGVRPVFYLKSSIIYASGNGSSSSPIRIN